MSSGAQAMHHMCSGVPAPYAHCVKGISAGACPFTAMNISPPPPPPYVASPGAWPHGHAVDVVEGVLHVNGHDRRGQREAVHDSLGPAPHAYADP